jgi:hypothetical protein
MDEKERKEKPVYFEEIAAAPKVITRDPNWKYVNVRRRLTYIERSIEEGTQWVVFEPNGEPLWERWCAARSALFCSMSGATGHSWGRSRRRRSS